jgi:hypothetical protein
MSARIVNAVNHHLRQIGAVEWIDQVSSFAYHHVQPAAGRGMSFRVRPFDGIDISFPTSA